MENEHVLPQHTVAQALAWLELVTVRTVMYVPISVSAKLAKNGRETGAGEWALSMSAG